MCPLWKNKRKRERSSSNYFCFFFFFFFCLNELTLGRCCPRRDAVFAQQFFQSNNWCFAVPSLFPISYIINRRDTRSMQSWFLFQTWNQILYKYGPKMKCLLKPGFYWDSYLQSCTQWVTIGMWWLQVLNEAWKLIALTRLGANALGWGFEFA